jgi:serine/threonine protein kinase
MTPELYEQIGRIYHAALGMEPEERAVFLDQICDGNEEMRREVERLLASNEEAGSFMVEPAVASAAELLAEEAGASLIGERLGRYKILSSIGAGGMGEVFLAQDTALGRRVAIKLLPAEFTADHDRVRRFEQEAKAASALNHPNIITIHEIGRAETRIGNLHFIAQEYIEGQTLRQRIKQDKLPLLDALDIAAQAANALQVAHTAGIVHRDIKPENIMLRPDGFVKILDFGLAKLTEREPVVIAFDTEAPTIAKTMPGTILGTAAYMSPEQARGLDVDSRSDVWSLGVLLYEMLTGQQPFKGVTPTDIIVSIIDREPPPLKESLLKTPPELERILMKVLAKKRDERYQTAKDLAIDLKNLKQRLEFNAELARISIPEITPESEPKGSGDAVSLPLKTSEHLARKTDPPRVSVATTPKPVLARPVVAVLLLAAAIGLLAPFAWTRLRPTTAPPSDVAALERQMTYSFTVQRMRDGNPFEEPFESSGQEFFENGWKFRINFNSPQPGFLYLLNEALAAKGAISYHILFPFPTINNGSAQLAADQTIQTGWYVVGENQGTEKLLIVWAAQPVGELEAVKGVVNPTDKSLISDHARLNAVRDFLNRHSQSRPEAETDKVRKQTDVKWRGDILVHTIEMEHR